MAEANIPYHTTLLSAAGQQENFSSCFPKTHYFPGSHFSKVVTCDLSEEVIYPWLKHIPQSKVKKFFLPAEKLIDRGAISQKEDLQHCWRPISI